ncbi:fimbrial protein StkG [Salmonella enterica subsp. enterica serovar Virchow]|uniref:fimbrial protein StkG n=1 Tax=Salmonella enterica TaxID=28901 RepID=UPI00107AE610|nr:fimbrial protein StkG [Salmonella enterica subsp. enterica serovar Virchow]EAA8193757.1 fimbrial protein StkG [Salmonella enterica]EBL1803029.1 fimbrial protein StkG [Salmonella enterica subsp. enterica serovar Rubislaw]EDR7427503.1 fimbrial protein StkG [Salmonella enterica subsp. enterica serovar Mikawasima]EAN3433833.1 fimbrial protein StkG [Salmonella enterica]
MKLSPYLAALLLLSASGTAYGAMECKFYNGDTRQIMSPGVQPIITFHPSVQTATLLASGITMELTPEMHSHCAVGDDGENIYQMTDNTLLEGYIDGKALFRTNIPGITYAIGLYPAGKGITGWFPLNPGQYYMTAYADDNEGYFENEKKWYAVMEIYQMPGFNGVPSGVGFISSIGGPLGRIVLGDPVGSESDHPRPLITISDMMFNIPFSEPTCILTAPTTVNLGDWYRSDLEKDQTTEVPFQITGSCTGTIEVSFVAKSSYTNADKNLFTNSITSNSSVTAAGGVGVKISSPAYPQIHADSTPEVIAVGEIIGRPVTSVNANFKAKLVKTGTEAVTPGIFGSSVTFQVTYE